MWDKIKDFYHDNYESLGKRVWRIIYTGLLGAPVLYLLAFAFEFLICFFSCGREGAFFTNCGRGIFGPTVWSGTAFWNTFLFLTAAGIVIGIIYAIAVSTQYSRRSFNYKIEAEKDKRKINVKTAGNTVYNIKNKFDNIISQINSVEKIIVSPRAKKLIEEAALEANKSNLELLKAIKIADKTKGKSSKTALKKAQQAETTIKLLEKDIDDANDLYNQAKKEEDDWNLLQQEALDADKSAKNAIDNAVKEAAKIENKVFVSEAAKDAAKKAFFALEKAKEAVQKTLKSAEAAAKAISANDARPDVTAAVFSAKRAAVEEKIVVEEVNIALEAG